MPDGFVDEASRPQNVGGKRVHYGYLMWPVPESKGTIHDRAYEARGLFGQRLYINPRENVVIVVWGAASKPIPVEPVGRHDFFAAVCESLR